MRRWCGVLVVGSWFRISGKLLKRAIGNFGSNMEATEEMKVNHDACKAAVAQNGECRAASTIAPGGNVCLWSTEPHRLKIYLKMRPTSGELADCLEGRKSNGGSRRTFWGLAVKSLL